MIERRWPKFLHEYGSSPHSQARRIQREMMWTRQSAPLGINKLRAYAGMSKGDWELISDEMANCGEKCEKNLSKRWMSCFKSRRGTRQSAWAGGRRAGRNRAHECWLRPVGLRRVGRQPVEDAGKSGSGGWREWRRGGLPPCGELHRQRRTSVELVAGRVVQGVEGDTSGRWRHIGRAMAVRGVGRCWRRRPKMAGRRRKGIGRDCPGRRSKTGTVLLRA